MSSSSRSSRLSTSRRQVAGLVLATITVQAAAVVGALTHDGGGALGQATTTSAGPIQPAEAATAVPLEAPTAEPTPSTAAADAAPSTTPPAVEPPTTTRPPSTTTAPPPPPAPRPATAPAAPPPAPAPTPPPPPPTTAPTTVSPLQRVQSSFQAAVPSTWRSAIPVQLEVIAGNVSWAEPSGRILVSEAHATGPQQRLSSLVAHEFGHLIAFRYGSRAYNGAAPSGWPAYSDRPEEAWADCVATAFTGIATAHHGLPVCSGESLSWTQSWLAQGPPW